MKILLISVAIVFGQLFVSVVANSKSPPPPVVSLEDKVRLADIIVIGEVENVIYLDEKGSALPSDPEDSRSHSAFLNIRVASPLFPGSLKENRLLVMHPHDFKTGPEIRAIISGRRLIFLLEKSQDKFGKLVIYRYLPMSPPEPEEIQSEIIEIMRRIRKTGPESPEYYRHQPKGGRDI